MSEKLSAKKEVEDVMVFTDPQERKRIRERAEALVKYFHDKNISNLILLDKSARPLTVLVRQTWARLYPMEQGPHITYINIGQEVTQSDGISLLNRAIEKLVASPEFCAEWSVSFKRELDKLSSQDDLRVQVQSAERAVEQIQVAAVSTDAELKERVRYDLGNTQNPLLFEALLRSLSDEEAKKDIYFTKIDEVARVYQVSLRRMHHAKTCIIDEYEHTGRTRIFSKWFVELLLRQAFPGEEGPGEVESLVFSSFKHPIFNQRHRGDYGPPWQKLHTEVTDWSPNFYRPLHSRAQWRIAHETSQRLEELNQDFTLDESTKNVLRKRLQEDRQSLLSENETLASIREELRQIASSQDSASSEGASRQVTASSGGASRQATTPSQGFSRLRRILSFFAR